MVAPHSSIVGFLRVVIAALCVRMLGAWVLGEGAVFGPDGTGAEAAVVLGGHPYPLHILLLEISGGDARALSMGSSSLTCGLLWLWGRRMGLGGAGGAVLVSNPGGRRGGGTNSKMGLTHTMRAKMGKRL